MTALGQLMCEEGLDVSEQDCREFLDVYYFFAGKPSPSHRDSEP